MFLTILYNLFIMPIQVIVEMTYSVMCRFLGDKGLALIGVSLVIQTLVLPLYKRSDALQDQEREKQASMAHWVNHIKKTFKGDERFMMLSTYYRQQNYKTYYSLKSSFSILLQVPFFLAAYNYLSHLQELKGVSFWFINDLGSPDHAFVIAGFAINILPIIMTLFNVISGIIYTKGLPFKSKLQVYGLAAIFLVILYNSPAGLVFYWTMNNLFSLLKNVFMKILKHPLEDLCGIIIAAAFVLGIYLYNSNLLSPLKICVILFICLCFIIPTVIKHVRMHHTASKEGKFSRHLHNLKVPKSMFFWEMVFLTLLMGVLIPVSVISTSASEFIVDYRNPFLLVVNNVSIYAGVFIIWFSIFYLLMKETGRKIFTIVTFAASGSAILNYMVFSKSHSTMSASLIYTKGMSFTANELIINLLALLVVFVALLAIAWFIPKISKYAVQVITLCIIALSIYNAHTAQTTLTQYENSRKQLATDNIFNLSKKGNNVVVIMLDRAIGSYTPYLFENNPELKQQFAGFTCYPNTLSFGTITNFGSPALFGGYEYTPDAMNQRSDESLADKHNEALKLMPAIFSKSNFDVTVLDPPYAGYQWDPDLSIYDEYDNVHAYVSDGAFADGEFDFLNKNNVKQQKSNFLYYSLMKVLPYAAQNVVYHDGTYFTTTEGDSSTVAVTKDFLNWYTSLLSLKRMTTITDDSSDNFLLMQNSSTHEPNVLKTPGYTPSSDIDEESELNKYNANPYTYNGVTLRANGSYSLSYIHVNMASFQALGDWFDYMRDNGVYDNTRIILVSDHAWGGLDQLDYTSIDNGDGVALDVMSYNALLMIKDFNSTEFTYSDQLMTNADVPTYATNKIIDNPTNPFTGKEINNLDKWSKPLLITSSNNYNINTNNGNVFDSSDGEWYEFSGSNIFDASCWKLKKYSIGTQENK